MNPSLVSPFESVDYDILVERAHAGDVAARDELLRKIWTPLQRIIGGLPVVRASCHAEDHAGNAAVEIAERLVRGRLLAQYLKWREKYGKRGEFSIWISSVARNQARDVMRQAWGRPKKAKTNPASPGNEARGGSNAEHVDGKLPSPKRLLNEFTASLDSISNEGERPPVTRMRTLQELTEFATERLPHDQLQALLQYLTSNIRQDNLTRAAIATLRRHFVGS